MTENHQYRTETHKGEYYEDEIELIDFLLILWKWKYFILVGTAICGLIVAIISFNRTKIYSIDMVLSPGILGIGREGKEVYIDSPGNIKALIESGKFNNDILKNLDNKDNNKIPKKMNFIVDILGNSNNIMVKYETSDKIQGIKILDLLYKLLIGEYDKTVQLSKSEYNIEWNLLKHKIDLKRKNIKSYERDIEIIEKRNNELISEMKSIKNNEKDLVAKKNQSLLKNYKENDAFRILFNTYLIQENARLSNNYLNKINDYKLKKEKQLRNIYKLDSEIESELNNMKKLKLKRENIQSIKILQPPTQDPIPVKPKTKLDIILALIAGLFVMTLLAFCLEFIKTKNEKGA